MTSIPVQIQYQPVLPLASQAGRHPWLHRLALLTAIATFPLIFMGGLVTSHQAGMSVPDWPNSYGYNMFLFPPRLWIGGILYEHTHRLMGTVVGFFAILLAMNAWGIGAKPANRRGFWIASGVNLLLAIVAAVLATGAVGSESARHLMPHFAVGFGSLAIVCAAGLLARHAEPRRWVRWLMLGVLAAVILQGAFGGTRVTRVNLTLAIIHGCFAQAFFCLATLAAIVTSRWWSTDAELSHPIGVSAGRRLVILAVICVAVVYAQLIVAATMRHLGAGLAIPDLPLAYGKLLPPMTAAQLDQANHLRVWQLDLSLVTLGQIWLHFAHRMGAIIVTLVVSALIATVLGCHRNSLGLLRPSLILIFLLLSQLTLGVLTVYYRKPADIASAHVAVGALVLVTSFLIAVRAMRLYFLRSNRPTS